MQINGIKVVNECSATYEDMVESVDHALNKYGRDNIRFIEMGIEDGYIGYTPVLVPFDRIRRITGYLVGSMNTWNNAKKAEEHDRVKHII